MRQTVPRVMQFFCAPRMINPHNMPPAGPCFIYANHSNNFDPFVINQQMVQEPTAGVMTRYQFYKTLPRIFMDSIGIVPTSKYVPEPEVIRSVLQMIDRRRMIIIFPEGGRRWDGRPKSMIEATLKLFWKMRIPVHPVQIHGSYVSWPRWADRPRRNSQELHWLSPLLPSDFPDYESFAEQCRQQVHFDENDPPESTLPKSAFKPALGIQRILYRCPYSGVSGSVYTPDGWSVYSRTSGAFSFRMDKNSRLIDKNGIPHSVSDFYDRIQTFSVEQEPRTATILNTRCSIYRIDRDNRIISLGYGQMSLTDEVVLIRNGSDRFVLALDQIQYISVEKNNKIALIAEQNMFMMDLGDQSALQWQQYINRLKKGEPTVRPFS